MVPQIEIFNVEWIKLKFSLPHIYLLYLSSTKWFFLIFLRAMIEVYWLNVLCAKVYGLNMLKTINDLPTLFISQIDKTKKKNGCHQKLQTLCIINVITIRTLDIRKHKQNILFCTPWFSFVSWFDFATNILIIWFWLSILSFIILPWQICFAASSSSLVWCVWINVQHSNEWHSRQTSFCIPK